MPFFRLKTSEINSVIRFSRKKNFMTSDPISSLSSSRKKSPFLVDICFFFPFSKDLPTGIRQSLKIGNHFSMYRKLRLFFSHNHDGQHQRYLYSVRTSYLFYLYDNQHRLGSRLAPHFLLKALYLYHLQSQWI